VGSLRATKDSASHRERFTSPPGYKLCAQLHGGDLDASAVFWGCRYLKIVNQTAITVVGISSCLRLL